VEILHHRARLVDKGFVVVNVVNRLTQVVFIFQASLPINTALFD